MNTREIGEIRRRVRRDRSNMPAIYGCYVNEGGEIVSKFRLGTGLMSENEAEKYFTLLRKTLSGTPGKHLLDISFSTAQVAGGEEHKLLMALRESQITQETLDAFYEKVMASAGMEGAYLILLGCDRYDVPFKSRDNQVQSDNSEEVYTYVLCAVCPVKQTKATLRYIPEEQLFHDGGICNVVSAPEMGFLFPAFDNRATNLYNALFYTHSPKESHENFLSTLFQVRAPMPAEEQKKSFDALLSACLDQECSLDVVQSVHGELCQRIAIHRESKDPETLLVDKEDVKQVLSDCGVSQEHLAKFSVDYDETFGMDTALPPKNLVDEKHFEMKTPDVSIRVSAERSDLIETRVIGGVKYILIQAEENVEVNGVPIHIADQETARV